MSDGGVLHLGDSAAQAIGEFLRFGLGRALGLGADEEADGLGHPPIEQLNERVAGLGDLHVARDVVDWPELGDATPAIG